MSNDKQAEQPSETLTGAPISTHDTLLNVPEKTRYFSTETLVEKSHLQHDTRPPDPCSIYNVPIEILFTIFELVALPRTPDGAYQLVVLTHVCRSWRAALIKNPRVWAMIFVTRKDHRSFVDMCLERSYPMPLEVTVDVYVRGPSYPSCTCDEDKESAFVPNDIKPCERHFVFESLAEKRHWERVHTLKIVFYTREDVCSRKQHSLALKSCRFLGIPSLQLTSLDWDDRAGGVRHLFSAPPFVPTLRSLSFRGSWDDHITKLNHLTSFHLWSDRINAEGFRRVILNNQSVETLSMGCNTFEGNSNGPPVVLSKLKTFSVNVTDRNSRKTISTLLRVPALQRLSSLLISAATGEEYMTDWFIFRATGDEIVFSIWCSLECIVATWQGLTGYPGPTIRRVRLENPGRLDFDIKEGGGVITLFEDAHTLEIGKDCVNIYCGFFNDLQTLRSKLKTIYFETPEEAQKFGELDTENRF